MALLRIDAHQHFWNLRDGEYSWLRRDEFGAIRRDFSPADLEPHLRRARVARTVTVQADNSFADTEAMLAHADRHGWVGAVIGWIPLLDPLAAERALDRYCDKEAFRGVRHLVHDEPDPDWLRREPVVESLRLLSERQLVFEIPAVFPRHLVHVPALAAELPELPIVIDHLGKPPVAEGALEPWATHLAAAAASGNVYAKVSGLGTEVKAAGWSAGELEPFVQKALECFGPDRLMIGSDWPVCLLAGEYEYVWEQTAATLAGLDDDSRSAVLGTTAARLYSVRQ